MTEDTEEPMLPRNMILARERMVYPSWHDRNMPSCPRPEEVRKIYSLKSEGQYDLPAPRSLRCFVVSSPVTSERSRAAFREGLGPEVEIDGVVYTWVGVEYHQPGSPVSIGEKIALGVRMEDISKPLQPRPSEDSFQDFLKRIDSTSVHDVMDVMDITGCVNPAAVLPLLVDVTPMPRERVDEGGEVVFLRKEESDTKKLTLPEFISLYDSEDGQPDPIWADHWATHLPEMLQGSNVESHHGDCTKAPCSCMLCMLEQWLREYREYFFDQGDTVEHR